MWKIAVGFIVFAALAMFVLMKSGGNIDLGGEQHGAEMKHEAPAAADGKADAGKADAGKAEGASPASADAGKK